MSDASIENYRSRSRALERQNRRRARAIVFSVVFAGAALAIWLLPKRQKPLPLDTSSRPGPRAAATARRDTIRRGEGVVGALVRTGLPRDAALLVLKASGTRATARRTIPVTLYADSAAAPVREVEFQIADDRSIRVLRGDQDRWTATERRERWLVDTVALRGPIVGSLVESLRRAGRSTSVGIRSRAEVAYAVAEAFEYKLDVGRDLAAGDSVIALVERQRTVFGAERIGPLIGGALFHDGVWLRAIRYPTTSGKPAYYDVDGKPLRTTFLAAPLEYRRMSSSFGFRVHPILGILRRHAGVDFAAPHGTPVRTVGDGVVIKATYAGGFGKLIEIRHQDGMVTRYGHLRGFAQGIREGQVVTQGEVIGFVGSTGLSTGPHLHFETLVNGVSREPHRTLREASGVPLTGKQLESFRVTSAALAARLAIPVPAAAAVQKSIAPIPAAAAERGIAPRVQSGAPK